MRHYKRRRAPSEAQNALTGPTHPTPIEPPLTPLYRDWGGDDAAREQWQRERTWLQEEVRYLRAQLAGALVGWREAQRRAPPLPAPPTPFTPPPPPQPPPTGLAPAEAGGGETSAGQTLWGRLWGWLRD